MKAHFDSIITGRKVLILGMGAEGKSTYRCLRKLYPSMPLSVADRREDLHDDPELFHPNTFIKSGLGYLDGINSFDLVFKSPGISLGNLGVSVNPEALTSQTVIFLEMFREQTIGITGTKGKSTTASLIRHLLSATGNDVLLIGNIGIPPFDVLERIHENTIIVFELSAHQLEGVRIAPHISVLLNIYQEHLDHYRDYQAYMMAKHNIGRWQQPNDFFIYHKNDQVVTELLAGLPVRSRQLTFASEEFSGADTFAAGMNIYTMASGIAEKLCNLDGKQFLPGRHNLLNLLAALTACYVSGKYGREICEAIHTFRGLEHRMEFVGEFRGVKFFNDSIATIPEAVIYALETIGDVNTLILGGYDRGVDYSALTAYLGSSGISNIFFCGEAGKRIKMELEDGFSCGRNLAWFGDFDTMVAAAISATPHGKSCLLSPAAASYDQFRNFEHRGNRFKELLRRHFS